MSNDVRLPITSESDSVTGLFESNNRGRSSTTYNITRSFRNNLGYPVSIIDRNNIVATIPPSSFSVGRAELIIEQRINFSENVNLNWDTVLNEQSSVPAIEAIRSLAKTRDIKVSTIGHEFIIEYSITHALLAKDSFAAYYEDLDIVVTKSSYAHNTVHPYSSVGQNLVIESTQNEGGFYYRVMINDPFSEFGERYVNVNGNVFKVRRTVDKSIKPGVYVYTKDECKTDNLYSPGLGTSYYPFDVADKEVQMYQSSQLAASLGDGYYKQEQEIKAKELDAKQKLMDLNLRKIEMESHLKDMEHQYKQENINLERENVKLKDELDREKMMREQDAQRDKFEYDRKARIDKDIYENRSHTRKDTTEFMKWLPGIIASIIGVANVLMMLQKGKT